MNKLRWLLLIFWLCTFIQQQHAQISNSVLTARAPMNDEACNAMVLNVNQICTYTTATNLGATTSPEPDPGCGNYNGGDVWFQATVPTNGIIKVTTQAGSVLTDGAMAFYTGACNALTQIACDRNSSPSSGSMPEIIATGLTPGSTIWIRFWESNNNDFGDFEICATTEQAPDNDEPCNATLLNVQSTCTNTLGNNINATASTGVPDPVCLSGNGNYAGGDVWYQAVVPANGHLFVITSAGTLTNGAIALYRGTCNALSLIACETTQGPGEWGEMSFVGLTPGETIWIRVWEENNNEEGTFNICVTSNPITPPPVCNTNTNAGATCATATSICSLDGYCGNTTSFSANYWPELDASFRTCIGSTNITSPTIIQNNSFLKFTASANTADFYVWVTSTNRGIGIQMMFFETNSCGSGPVICHGGYDDIRPGPEKLITATGLVPGNTYFLMIDGVSNDQCNYVIKAVTPPSAPTAGTLSGTSAICLTTTNNVFTSTIPGGTWSSGNPSVATIHPTNGTITPLTSGTVAMTYTIPGIGVCPNATGSRNVTITAPPTAGTLLGSQNICSDNTSTVFSSTQLGGTWSTSNVSIATINSSSGLITPIAAGTATMTYTVNGTGGCPDATDTRIINITANPTAGTLGGTQAICLTNTSNIFSSSVAGGSWSSANNAIATINPTTGLITPIAAGNTTMTYTVLGTPGICPDAVQTRALTITAPPSAGTLSGNQNLCIGGSSSFTSTISGGTWSSSNPGVATINPNTGIITPVSAGNATMTYTVTGTGSCPDATDTRIINITANPTAGTLGGTQAICLTNTSNIFSSSVAGGSWSSANNAIATINPTTGLITPIAAGNTTMTYTVSGTPGICPDAVQTRSLTITAPPSAGTLSGNQTICSSNNTTPFSSTQPGGTWSSSNNSIATINSSTGIITPVATGTSVMTYTVSGAGVCPDAAQTLTATIVTTPTASIIANNGPICKNTTANFSISGTPNSTVTYQLNGGNTQSTVLNNTGTATLSIPTSSNNQALTLLTASLSGCAQNLSGSGTTSSVSIAPFDVTLTLSPPTSLAGGNVQASINSSNGIISSSIWQPSNLFSNNISNQIFTAPSSSLTITVTATSAQGCTDTKSQFLEIIKKNQIYYIPNAFVPGQGNDPDINTLRVYGPDIQSATLKIFNQWGQCIFESTNPKQKGWDGKFKGQLQPSGVYVYGVQITFNDGSSISKTGSVNLIR